MVDGERNSLVQLFSLKQQNKTGGVEIGWNKMYLFTKVFKTEAISQTKRAQVLFKQIVTKQKKDSKRKSLW